MKDMQKIRFKVKLDTGFAGCIHTGELEIDVDDNATEEEISQQLDEETREWAMNYLDYYYEIINED